MKKFEVDFYDYATGATSPIDTIIVPDDYTPRDYARDCERNGIEWLNGMFIFYEIED